MWLELKISILLSGLAIFQIDEVKFSDRFLKKPVSGGIILDWFWFSLFKK